MYREQYGEWIAMIDELPVTMKNILRLTYNKIT